MTAVLRLGPWLLIAAAMKPAAAEPPALALQLHPPEPKGVERPTPLPSDPIIGLRLLQEQSEAWPMWVLTPRDDDRGRRGLSFGVRPGRGLKATAKIRF
jgi:hypothetical protein